jgi:hypothetical protein
MNALRFASIFALSAAAAACGPVSPGDDASVDAAVVADAAQDARAPEDGASAALSAQEVADLRFLREEEKLARDVYNALTGQVAMVFNNIAASEQRHMDSVLELLVRYAIPDPAAGMAAGRFADPTLQSLYTSLVASGGASSSAALAVGAEIEELDIYDIRRLRTHTTRADILAVYDLLELGSRNHLRTFYGRIRSTGATYTPTHLDQASFDAIVTSPMEMGAR